MEQSKNRAQQRQPAAPPPPQSLISQLQPSHSRTMVHYYPEQSSLPMGKSIDTQSVLKRLQSELMAVMMSGDCGISAFPEEDNIFCWKGSISGSKETVFEGIEYKLSLSFPNDYPFKVQTPKG